MIVCRTSSGTHNFQKLATRGGVHAECANTAAGINLGYMIASSCEVTAMVMENDSITNARAVRLAERRYQTLRATTAGHSCECQANASPITDRLPCRMTIAR